MNPSQYWDDDPWLYAAYAEARRLADERSEWERWQLGLYVYNSILMCAPVLNPFSKSHKPQRYPDEPYGISQTRTAEENDARAEKMAHAKMMEWMLRHGPST